MSGHSSARSSLEEPFWEERGCSALSKNNPVAGPKITKLLWSSAGLEAGPRQLLLAAPRVCCAAGAAGGAGEFPTLAWRRISDTGRLGEMGMLSMEMGQEGQGLLLGRSLRKKGWRWVLGRETQPCGFLLFHRVQDWCLDLLRVCGVSASSPPAKSP